MPSSHGTQAPVVSDIFSQLRPLGCHKTPCHPIYLEILRRSLSFILRAKNEFKKNVI